MTPNVRVHRAAGEADKCARQLARLRWNALLACYFRCRQ
jgi:hypothetical protein